MTNTDSPLIVLDVETTGLDHRTERIIEIGAVRLEKGEVVDFYSTLVKPEVPIRHSSFKIHGISEEMVADAPEIGDVMPTFLEFLEDHPFVAHNAIFDYSFLNEASKRLYDKRIRNLRIDTFEMFRVVFPEEHSHGLSALLNRFGYPSDVAHRALDDAKCLALVYPKLREMYEQQLAWYFAQLPNVPYLLERYLRLQKTAQMLQADMNDLREIFKLYFNEGGTPVTATTGELMVSSYRRNYEYDDAALRQIIEMAGLGDQAYKVNIRSIDKLIENKNIDVDIRDSLKDARTQITENRVINFIRQTEPKDSEEEKK